LVFHIGGVGDQPIDRHHRNERRDESQERVEGNAGGDNRSVRLADRPEGPLQNIEPASGRHFPWAGRLSPTFVLRFVS
jgi:hypothetical protein